MCINNTINHEKSTAPLKTKLDQPIMSLGRRVYQLCKVYTRLLQRCRFCRYTVVFNRYLTDYQTFSCFSTYDNEKFGISPFHPRFTIKICSDTFSHCKTTFEYPMRKWSKMAINNFGTAQMSQS